MNVEFFHLYVVLCVMQYGYFFSWKQWIELVLVKALQYVDKGPTFFFFKKNDKGPT